MLSHSIKCCVAFATPLRPTYALESSRHSNTLRCRRLPQSRVFVAQTRMCLTPDDQPEQSPDAMNSFNMEILRRRMTDLGERQKAGHEPSDQILDLSGMHDEDDDDDDEYEAERLAEEFDRLGTVWVIVFTSSADGSEGVYSLSIAEENIVLAFQDKEEAQRYSFCLEAQKFPVPQICELDTAELREFCSESGFRLGFVPKGSLISPPDESAIEDLEKWRGSPPSSGNSDSSGMSEEDIDTMKKRLDSLFGQ